MSRNAIWMRQLQRPWIFPGPFRTASSLSSIVRADALRVVREPLRLTLGPFVSCDPPAVARLLGRAALGCSLDAWLPPSWLLPHQMDAARRDAGSLRVFGGSLLADAVGLGKTFVALAVTTQYRRAVAIVPASLMEQWRRVSHRVRAPLNLVSHEALSRGRRVPAADCVIVDEAHRFRNPDTRRYDRLARDLRGAPLLLVTATPVVNRPRDLASLLRLFLPDNGLAVLGVPSIDRAIGERDYAGLAHACAPLVVARSVSVLAPRSVIALSVSEVFASMASTSPVRIDNGAITERERSARVPLCLADDQQFRPRPHPAAWSCNIRQQRSEMSSVR